MKKITTLLSLFFLLSGNIYGFNAKEYYRHINCAEQSIVQKNYKLALKYYDSAFKSWQAPFATDIYNALLCANIDSNNTYVANMATRLMVLGCEIAFFERPDYLQFFRTSAEWGHLINEYPQLRIKYLKTTDLKLRTKIDQLLCKDQRLRDIDPGYTYLKDSIYKVDDTIKMELRTIFGKKFPNEYDYGVYVESDTVLMKDSPLQTLLLHNYGKFDTSVVPNANVRAYDFTKILMKAIESGKMPAQEFAYLNDRSGQFKINEGFLDDMIITEINGKYYYDNQSHSVENKANENRRSIHLVSRAAEREKAVYCIKNKNKFIFFHFYYITSFPGMFFSEKQIKGMFTEIKLDQ